MRTAHLDQEFDLFHVPICICSDLHLSVYAPSVPLPVSNWQVIGWPRHGTLRTYIGPRTGEVPVFDQPLGAISDSPDADAVDVVVTLSRCPLDSITVLDG